MVAVPGRLEDDAVGLRGPGGIEVRAIGERYLVDAAGIAED